MDSVVVSDKPVSLSNDCYPSACTACGLPSTRLSSERATLSYGLFVFLARMVIDFYSCSGAVVST